MNAHVIIEYDIRPGVRRELKFVKGHTDAESGKVEDKPEAELRRGQEQVEGEEQQGVGALHRKPPGLPRQAQKYRATL